MKKRSVTSIFTFSLFLFSILFPNFLKALETNFPDLAAYSDSHLETENERQIGYMIMQRIQGSNFLVADPVVNEYLRELALKFNQQTGRSDFKLHFFGVQTPELNAFAFFGGHVAVHSGLILAVRNESELAAVLAHETAHITQRHLARMMAANRKMMPITFAEILAAIAIGALGSPEAGTHLATAAMAGHTQQMINFTREHEQEADRIGIQLLSQTEFDPHALPTVFQRMKQEHRYKDTPPEYLLTHPIFEARIADAQNRARMFPPRQTQDSLFFHLARARLEIAKEENSTKKLNRLKEGFTAHRYQNKTAAQYAYALALLRNQRAGEAIPFLQELLNENANAWPIELSLAEAEQSNGQLELALARTEHLIGAYPANYPILLEHATLLLQAKQPEKAIKLLNAQRKRHWDDPLIHQLLAKSYSMAGQPIELHRAQAEWHVTRGEFKEAFQQLDLALESAEHNKPMTKIIQDRKEMIKDMLEQQRAFRF